MDVDAGGAARESWRRHTEPPAQWWAQCIQFDASFRCIAAARFAWSRALSATS